MANFNSNGSFGGLSTYIVGVPTTDTYIVQGTLVLPSLARGNTANSSVVVVVKVNNTTSYTGLAGATGFRTSVNCTANDLISVITSSADAVDQASKNIRTTVSIYEGVS